MSIYTTQVFQPKNLRDVTTIMNSYESPTIVGGATYINFTTKPQYILDLSQLHFLYNNKNTTFQSEFGAMLSIDDLLRLNPKHTPQLLQQAIPYVVPPHLRMQARLAGNIATHYPGFSLRPILSILDTKILCQRNDSTQPHWISLNFNSTFNNTCILQIQINNINYSKQKLLYFPFKSPYYPLSIIVLINTDENLIIDMHLIIIISNITMIALNTSEFNYQTVPLSQSHITQFLHTNLSPQLSNWAYTHNHITYIQNTLLNKLLSI